MLTSTANDGYNRNVKEPRVVRGEVALPATGLAADTADLIVQVEDVSRADAPSIVIAEQRQPGVSLRAGALLPFEVEVPADRIDEQRSYTVRVHVNLSKTGEVEVGDFVSTQSYPVLTRGYGSQVRVDAKRV